MPTLTVKNIPSDLYSQLKETAKANRRSMNSEVIVCIERALHSRKINTKEILTRARNLRDKTAKHPITDKEFTQAKNIGRL